jgi:hypothetical protein
VRRRRRLGRRKIQGTRWSRLALGLAFAGASPAAQASITGVCPDGSIFVVQSAEAIPCSQAKHVEPGEVPPLKPALLPRPYAWEVFQQQQDPNNPYNLVDAARQVREARAADPSAAPPQAALSTPPPSVGLVPPQPEATTAAAPRPAAAAGPLDLGLSDEEARDLALIVELSQQRAPAALERSDDGGATLSLRVAPSAAFEARLREALTGRGHALAGPVLLFSVRAAGSGVFHPNFTFVQDHEAFHPDAADPAQLGLIRGSAGAIGPESEVLGYAVLPAGFELGRPLDLYWDDRQLSATLRP